jgi:Melibiase
MRRRGALIVVGLLAAIAAPAPSEAAEYREGSVFARVSPTEVVLGNSLAERRWDRAAFRTTALVDRRGQDRTWSAGRRDFSLTVAGVEVGSEALRVDSARVTGLPRGGLRVVMELSAPISLPSLSVTRVAEAYPGVAGFRVQTVLTSPLPVALARASLDEAAVGGAAPALHAFRAGGDWREPGWEGPAVSVGDPHAGTWRDSRGAGAGESLRGPGQWLSMGTGDRSLFMVMERNDFPSSRLAYDGEVASAAVDWSRDLISFGPFEEQVHAENPAEGPGRVRLLRPGEPLALPAAFTGFGLGDGDEEWQFHRYLTDHRLVPYERAVTFNSNGTDQNLISTGAKDDMDIETVREVAPIARRLGVETFILDDGWQARSGDWQPDSPEYPEPRWDGDPDSMFAPRFPDAEFQAVREAIAPMRLGLWMSPTFFNPSSEIFQRHPEWACAPVGDALAAANLADPEGGSNEAGIGAWGPAALPHVEARIRDGIENWGVAYWKFDFLLWLDCVDSGGARDLYEYHDAFVAMLDRLRADHPEVTFQIDETNDYRLFPFESLSRGPLWFQNGGPSPDRMLHNLWNLSPYVPGFALGQEALADQDFARYPVDTLMAASLLSHITFFHELRRLPDAVIDRVRLWTDFYKRNRDLLGGVVYPLLDDPLAGGWTALQAWDPEAGRGALLAFRQRSETSSRTIALRNVPPGRTFALYEGVEERPLGTVTSSDLAAGLPVEIPEQEGTRVLLIR